MKDSMETNLLSSIMDSINSLIVICDVKGVIINVSRRALEVFHKFPIIAGHTKAEAFLDYLNGIVINCNPSDLINAAKEKLDTNGECTISLPGGIERTYSLRLHSIYEKERKTGYILTLADVSFYREMISEIATTQRTVTAIFESNPHMNVMFDSELNVIDCNPSAIKFMGFSNKDEMISGFAEEMTKSIPPFQAGGRPSRSVGEVLMSAAKDGYIKDEIELVIRNKTRILDMEIKRIPYGDGFALLGYMMDLTDMREKEEALAQRSSELESAIEKAATAVSEFELAQHTVSSMFEANPHMNVMFDDTLRAVDCNPSAIKFMGFDTKEEMLAGFAERMSKSIPSFQSSGRASRSMIEVLAAAVKAGYMKFETELVIDGETRIIDMEFKRIPYGDSFALLGYMMDLTEKHKLQQALEDAVKSAEAANQAKSAFLANMSHEIRTPMNSIMGFAELALGSDLPPKTREHLEYITDSTKWLLRIINDILDISKIESGKMELEHVPFDLHGIFMRCQSVILPNVNEKGLDLHVYAEPTIGRKLLGDPVRLYQALMNLLSNAVKFTGTGAIKLSSSIKNASENAVTVYFEVKDSGIGMSAEQMEKVFEPFTQADSSTTRNYGGTGLGLTIAKNIVEMMGGNLKLESKPGAGSKFSFELMFQTVGASDEIPVYDEIKTVEKPHFDGLILICEDNSMNQQVISEHLSSVGLQSVIAENGKMGVEMVEERIQSGKKPFDLIFMDIFMPIMDGVETASKIAALDTGTPIVAMTANVMTGELENYKKNGMLDYIGKPFTSQELWRCLLKYITPLSTAALDETMQTKDDDELQKKLRVKFAKDNPDKYAEITGAIAAGDVTLAHRLAHTLKTNAGMIGRTVLQNAAASLEASLNDGAIPHAEQMAALEAALSTVLEELKPLLDESIQQAWQGGDLDKDQALALFYRLEPMLENINPECVNLLDEIRSLPNMEKLARQIEDYDFESAARTLDEIKKKWVT